MINLDTIAAEYVILSCEILHLLIAALSYATPVVGPRLYVVFADFTAAASNASQRPLRCGWIFAAVRSLCFPYSED